MATVHDPTASGLRELASPARNNYFYGKLMSAFHFQMEQAYFNRKRWLLNRLALGSGVLCGLEVVVAEGGQRIWVRPGVALDPLGREIVVPAGYCVESPRQPTDECGRPAGEPIGGAGVVTLLLCYHECETEPVPVLVGDCDTRQDCAPGTLRERFMVRVVAGAPAARPAGLSDAQCAAIFPEHPGPDFDRRAAACAALAGDCLEPAGECVVLATVTLPADPSAPVEVDQCGYRSSVYSNSELFDLLSCLSERVDACCEQRLLRYVSGDAQTGSPLTQLANPLVVAVVDRDGNPVANEMVTFSVRGGGGSLAPATAASAADGTVQTSWTLGPAPGLNSAAAAISGAAELSMFALAAAPAEPPEPPPVATPPVVVAIWPDYASRLSPTEPEPLNEWLQRPIVAITFDREMNQDLLQDPEVVSRWLRVHQLIDRETIVVSPVEPRFSDITDGFRDRAGFTAIYELNLDNREQPARYLIQMRAADGNIADTSTPPLTLDADFAGTTMSATALTQVWNLTGPQTMTRTTTWNRLVDTGRTLPRSGDGNEGGNFHGWFELTREG